MEERLERILFGSYGATAGAAAPQRSCSLFARQTRHRRSLYGQNNHAVSAIFGPHIICVQYIHRQGRFIIHVICIADTIDR